MLSETASKESCKESRRTAASRHAALAVVFAIATLLVQSALAAPGSSAGLEFPVIMRQNVVAGTTPVGTKVQAKLTVATLVNGVVIPQDAILSGEVTESVAKSATDPSRLAIRMDSAQWKNGASPMVLRLSKEVYLTAWYYPATPPAINQDLSSGLPDAGNNAGLRTGGAFPGARNPASPLPGLGTGRDSDTPPDSTSDSPKHRILMKNVESERNSDAAVTLTSKHFNIKIDKRTTYVLAAADLANGPG